MYLSLLPGAGSDGIDETQQEPRALWKDLITFIHDKMRERCSEEDPLPPYEAFGHTTSPRNLHSGAVGVDFSFPVNAEVLSCRNRWFNQMFTSFNTVGRGVQDDTLRASRSTETNSHNRHVDGVNVQLRNEPVRVNREEHAANVHTAQQQQTNKENRSGSWGCQPPLPGRKRKY